jgi:hypothetical protein
MPGPPAVGKTCPTPIQLCLLDLAEVLALVRVLSWREREAFASIARLMLLRSLDPELLIAEAEAVLERAA